MPLVLSGRNKTSGVAGRDPYYTTYIRKVNESYVRKRIDNQKNFVLAPKKATRFELYKEYLSKQVDDAGDIPTVTKISEQLAKEKSRA